VLCLSQVFPVQNIIVNFPTRCQVDLKVPVVVRLEGTNVDQGKRILKVRAVDDSGAWFLVYMFWFCFVVWKHTCLLVIFIFIFAGKWNDFDHCRRSWWCGRESCKSIHQITSVSIRSFFFSLVHDEQCFFTYFGLGQKSWAATFLKWGYFGLVFMLNVASAETLWSHVNKHLSVPLGSCCFVNCKSIYLLVQSAEAATLVGKNLLPVYSAAWPVPVYSVTLPVQERCDLLLIMISRHES